MRHLILALFFFLAASQGAQAATFGERVASAALEQTTRPGVYDPAYVRISYPMGDVPADRGVCSDVVIRALRTVGVDLQARVHEDMKADFAAYPKHWGLKRPDRNIDHRRVPNLQTYFRRAGYRLAVTADPANFRPGDIVAWNLKGDSGYLPHIGVVTGTIGRSGRPMIVHNIGAGPKHEDALFAWKMTGHYRITLPPAPSP